MGASLQGDVALGTVVWGLGQLHVIVIPELSASHRNFLLTLPAGPSPSPSLLLLW